METARGQKEDHQSHFLRIPAELRLIVYEHLLIPGPGRTISIKTHDRTWKNLANTETPLRRASYYALERSLGRCSYRTTYGRDASSHGNDKTLHPAIMAVNRKIYEETSHLLYGSHTFSFDQHLDALGPFISDLRPPTRNLVECLALRCMPHSPSCCASADARLWNNMSERLKDLPRLRKMRIVLQGGRSKSEWDGPRDLSVSDIKLLYQTRHECMGWARELSTLASLESVEIVADVKHMPRPETTATLIYAALSASIETTLVRFLAEFLGIPARAGVSGPDFGVTT